MFSDQKPVYNHRTVENIAKLYYYESVAFNCVQEDEIKRRKRVA